ncbi:MAG: general secretion pathway protein GspL [Steroidobacteraceae bacterium]|nr:general secretion pathway protein GspL [Deltaproteobacteria bacterium]
MDYLILQVEEKRVTVAQFGISGHTSRLIGAALFELDSECSLADVVQQAASGLKSSPRVILCLPPALFAQRTVSLPFDDLRKVREVLPAQLQGEISIPVDELVLDVLPSGSGSFLALWARKSDISHAISLFREAGLEPQVITSLPFANGFIPGVPAECFVFDGNALSVLHDGKLTFFRPLDAASAPAMIATTLSALELSGAMPPERICPIGSAAGTPAGLEALPLEIESLQTPADMGHLFKNDETFLQLAGLYAVARASQAGALPDFRRGELAWTAGDVRMRKKLLLTGVLIAAMISIMFVSKVMQYRAVNADIVSLNKSIAGMYREIFPTRAKAVDELSEVRGEIKKLAGVDSSSAYLDLLKKLAEAKGNTINGLYEAEIEGRNLRIKGDARSALAVNEFKSALAPLLATAELGEVKSRPDGTFSFSLTGTLKEGTK